MKRTISIILAVVMCLSTLVVGTISSVSAKTKLPKTQMYIVPDLYKGSKVVSYFLDEFNDYKCNFMIKVGNSKFYNANKLVNSVSMNNSYFAHDFNYKKHRLLIAVKNAVNKNVSVKATVGIINSNKAINNFINSCVNKNKDPLSYKSLKNYFCNKKVTATATMFANRLKIKICDVKKEIGRRTSKGYFLTSFDRNNYNFSKYNNIFKKDKKGYYIKFYLNEQDDRLVYVKEKRLFVSHKKTSNSFRNIKRYVVVKPAFLFQEGYILS